MAAGGGGAPPDLVSLGAVLMVALKGTSLWLGSGLHLCLSLPPSRALANLRMTFDEGT